MSNLPDLPDFLSGQAEPSPEAPPPLRDEIAELVKANLPALREDGWKEESEASDQIASAVMHLLRERGHIIEGAPPARQILDDAQQFAAKLTLAMLCVRLVRVAASPIKTPESKAMERWLNDYLDGRNHGPIGKPMFWPSNLPGLCDQLRDWGFRPTDSRPKFVARMTPEEIEARASGATPPTIN